MSLKTKQGFTLIELVIVLAIGALIIAAVLLAVGGAQRTQRDNARKDIAGRVATALQNYASNNNGSYTGFTCNAASGYCNGINDPDTNNAPTAGTTATATSGVVYAVSSVCTGGGGAAKTGPAIAGTTRNYAVVFYVESAGGTTTGCIDNK